MTMQTTPAQLVFIEARRGRWVGRLLNPEAALDASTGLVRLSGRPSYTITETGSGAYVARMRGGGPASTRYRNFHTLADAQRHGIRWAGRRFRVEAA